jgi:EAL domain-containing protein (putative c-di-GMP-specific phosphodiesterase class I)
VKSGVRLALDDFGTGHSALVRLARITFAQVKLDAEFISHALNLQETWIIEALVGLVRTMGFGLLAGSTETESTCNGCGGSEPRKKSAKGGDCGVPDPLSFAMA